MAILDPASCSYCLNFSRYGLLSSLIYKNLRIPQQCFDFDEIILEIVLARAQFPHALNQIVHNAQQFLGRKGFGKLHVRSSPISLDPSLHLCYCHRCERSGVLVLADVRSSSNDLPSAHAVMVYPTS